MAETSTSNYKIGDRVVATASELNGHMGTIKFIGQVSFFLLFLIFRLPELKEHGMELNLM